LVPSIPAAAAGGGGGGGSKKGDGSSGSDDCWLLLDAGEGTLGAMQRLLGQTAAAAVLLKLSVIWVSHKHADHMLGVPALLQARTHLQQQQQQQQRQLRSHAGTAVPQNSNTHHPSCSSSSSSSSSGDLKLLVVGPHQLYAWLQHLPGHDSWQYSFVLLSDFHSKGGNMQQVVLPRQAGPTTAADPLSCPPPSGPPPPSGDLQQQQQQQRVLQPQQSHMFTQCNQWHGWQQPAQSPQLHLQQQQQQQMMMMNMMLQQQQQQMTMMTATMMMQQQHRQMMMNMQLEHQQQMMMMMAMQQQQQQQQHMFQQQQQQLLFPQRSTYFPTSCWPGVTDVSNTAQDAAPPNSKVARHICCPGPPAQPLPAAQQQQQQQQHHVRAGTPLTSLAAPPTAAATAAAAAAAAVWAAMADKCGFASWSSVPVEHCAGAHGLVLGHRNGWKLVYSGAGFFRVLRLSSAPLIIDRCQCMSMAHARGAPHQ
jgi:hypothetical protein